MFIKSKIRITRGCQPYLYDAVLIPEGKRVITLGTSEMFFGDLVEALCFLIDPYVGYLTDREFAKHLLAITSNDEYEFTLHLDEDDEIFLN